MQVRIFAHTPPPHHGQSYMVQLMVEGFGGDYRERPRPARSPLGIECYLVNARVSKKLEEIGDFRAIKLFLLFDYCLQAIWCRFRYGIHTFYFIPAPGKPSALYRDWIVMFLCRPFFKHIVLHWHAAGLAKWLETVRQIRARTLTYHALKHVDASIVLSESNRRDAEKFWPKQIKIVGNGIPDPCPGFREELLPRRKARLAARKQLVAGEPLTAAAREQAGGDPHIFKVVYLAHCTRPKGLFDALDAVALANQQLTLANSAIRLRLTVAGQFLDDSERVEFDQRIAAPDLQLPHPPLFAQGANADASRTGTAGAVEYVGFISGAEKNRILADSDCFCFPTYYTAEVFPVVVLEAIAFGAMVVTTRWRAIPELLPRNYAGLVEARLPGKVAAAFLEMLERDDSEELRAMFLAHFTLERYLANLAAALHSAEQAPACWTPDLLPQAHAC
jgi:glycosyltransferase involved in cell wall biosynthesis